MAKIVLTAELMKYMSLFTQVTHTGAKDCIEQPHLLMFVVNEGMVAKAIGKGGVNAKKLEQRLRKKVKVIEYNSDPKKFITGLVYPNKITEITEEDGVYTITAADNKSRSMLIGRNAINLRSYEDIVKRYFAIKELKVN